MQQDFSHLRVKSCYSLLQSTVRIKSLIAAVKLHNMNTVALCDHNNMFAGLEFAIEAKKAGIKAIHGLVWSCQEQELLILAKDHEGYKNLMYLSSHQFNLDVLFARSEGLIVLSAYDKGYIGKAIYNNQILEAKAFSKKMKEVFADRFYFEISREGRQEQTQIEDIYLQLSYEMQIPLAATNEVLFIDQNTTDDHDTLLAISSNCHKDEQDRPRSNPNCYFKTGKQIHEIFSDIPEAVTNAANIGVRCSYMAKTYPPMLPSFENESRQIRDLSYDGLRRLGKSEDKLYIERLEYELGIICKMNFSGYFLVVSDFIRWAKDNNIMVGPGRGSGSGSLVAWCLDITDLDPIEFGLIFERFLNPDRVSMPDFDIDFCQKRRHEVIDYIKQKYGKQNVAHIITFGSMQAKAVLKDVARALGLRFDISNYITDLVPFSAVNPVTLQQAVNEVPELNMAYRGNGIYKQDIGDVSNELIKRVIETSLELEGLPRHVSMHAAGVVIAPKPIVEIMPFYTDPKTGELLTQYSMKYTELAGLIKFDFLGLQTLTLIDNTKKYIEKLDLKKLDITDQETYKLLASGRTNGVFQFESGGMQDVIKRLKPKEIEDLLSITSLYRPGPMGNIPLYLSAREDESNIHYPHPMLKDTLKNTYGVIIYQEQVMKIAQVLSGYTLAQADVLRKAMGKKIKAEMQSQEEIFVKGAIKNNVDPNLAKEIFALVAKFAGYGFNRAHAAAYGMISFYTAYLKAHYTGYFLISCMNLELNDSNKVAMFIQDAKDTGITVEKIDINLCEELFIYNKDKNSIYFGLAVVKGIGIEVAKQIVVARKRCNSFKNIFHFVEQMENVSKKTLESLILVGAFDKLHSNRKQLHSSIEKLLSHSQVHKREREMRQMSLLQPDYSEALQKVEEFHFLEKMDKEFDYLGQYLSAHPLEYYDVEQYSHSKSNYEYGRSTVRIAGILVKKDSRMSEKGVFSPLILSDAYGYTHATIFQEEVLQQYSELLYIKSPIVILCEAKRTEGGVSFSVVDVEKLEDKKNIVIEVKNISEIDGLLCRIKHQQGYNVYIKTPMNNVMQATIHLPDAKIDC